MNEPFETYAIVEIFGHTRIAGRVSEQVIAGNGFLRVDVPELPEMGRYPLQPAFTRLYGTAAIYSITPVSEEIALQAAQSMRVRPVDVYIAVPQLAAALDEGLDDEDYEYDDEANDDKDF